MKKAIILLIVLGFCLGLALPAFAADEESQAAAEELYELGLFSGVGTNEDGTPDFDLDREPTRNEAVTMLVRLLGKEEEALAGTWDTPFTDVAGWAKPYVGYAYANGLTKGTGETTFGGSSTVSATQYLTFVLRAMGYVSGTDFQWNRAWELSDAIGMTDGRYNGESGQFLRGDIAVISRNALYVSLKDGEETLLESLGLAPEIDVPKAWYETDDDGKLYIRTNMDASKWNGYTMMLRWNLSNGSVSHDNQAGFGPAVCYNSTSSFSWLYSMPEVTTIVSTEVVILDDASLIDTVLEQIDSGVSFEDRTAYFSEHVKAQFVLENPIHLEITEDSFTFTSFSLERNDDGTETYIAYIDAKITSQGEYGLVFRGADGTQRHSLSYIGKADGYLTFTRNIDHFGKPGTKGTFYIAYCVHRMEENGEIICACAQSSGLEYTIE